MTTKTKTTIERAARLAGQIVEVFTPACLRVEVAGSVRRRKPVVGDIEIVAIPRYQQDLFGGRGESLLDHLLSQLCEQGRLARVKGGESYRQYNVCRHDCNLDLFICNEDTWGCVFTIRTGSADFSHKLVTKKQQGGHMPNDYHMSDNRIWDSSGMAFETPEELDVFRVLGLMWIDPWNRE